MRRAERGAAQARRQPYADGWARGQGRGRRRTRFSGSARTRSCVRRRVSSSAKTGSYTTTFVRSWADEHALMIDGGAAHTWEGDTLC